MLPFYTFDIIYKLTLAWRSFYSLCRAQIFDRFSLVSNDKSSRYTNTVVAIADVGPAKYWYESSTFGKLLMQQRNYAGEWLGNYLLRSLDMSRGRSTQVV